MEPIVRAAILLAALLSLISVPVTAKAQHPAEVQRAVADGDFFKALSIFNKMPKRKASIDAYIAAARSAWALSLPMLASQYYDRALQDSGLNDELRARAYLSRGVIEFQEGRYEAARLFAERAVNALPDISALRSKAWLLWADSLTRLEWQAAAEEKYINALDEADPDERAEVHFALGSCEARLGKLAEARSNFEQIPLNDERAPEAIRSLAHIALQQKDFKQAAMWLEKARADYPDKFIDSWVDYTLMEAAVQSGDALKVAAIRTAAAQRFTESDHWLTLLNASAELFESRKLASFSGGTR